jgi:polar amino acid transport system substrate-binding protein
MHPMKRLIPGLLLALLSGLAAAETLVVGLPEPGRPPYFWRDEHQRIQGSYVQLLQRIGTIAGADIEFRMVPQSRLIAEFDGDRIQVEPGVAPAWRPAAKDVANSRYTQAFMAMNDVLIEREGLQPEIASLAALAGQPQLKIGQVRGFYTPEGIAVVSLNNELDIARLVHEGGLDVGFMNQQVAEHFKATLGLHYGISPVVASAPVALRINRQQEKWVEPFDRAIAQLRKSGELKKLFD